MDYNLEETPLYKLLLEGRSLKLPKGQVINAFDDNVQLNLIKSGFIKRYLITNEGTKGIQVIYGPDNLFPLTPIYKAVYKMNIYSGPEQYYYESMTDIEIFSISQSTLIEALEKNPLIYKDLFYAAGLRLNSYIHRLESMSLRVANRKVANQLVYMADVFGKKTENGATIMVPVTHQNLADILNLARETVTNCMIRLEEKGLIRGEKQITVLDLDKLRQASH